MCGPRGLAVPCPVISNWRATAPSGKQAQASLCTLQPVPSQQLGKQGVFMCLHVYIYLFDCSSVGQEVYLDLNSTGLRKDEENDGK